MMNILSLGAGVQSSTLALMAAHGEIGPMPDAAIFADTSAEPKGVYDWLDWLETKLPFPVHRVMHKEGLTREIERSLQRGKIGASPPWFSLSNGVSTPMRRACTNEYKVGPVQKKVRELSGAKRGEKDKAYVWIGISLDEADRMKPSRFPHYQNRFPLLERTMTREGCLHWMRKHGYPRPSKSSCVYCPYHNNEHWRDLKLNDAPGFAEAVRVDELIRNGVRDNGKPAMYAHRSLVPLADIDFRNAADVGQVDMFGNECEGMCGV